MSKSTLALAALFASAAIPTLVQAQAANAPAEASSTAVDELVVTGTNIRGASAKGFNPVQVIGLEEVKTSGKVTVADLLRSISANTGNSTNETSNSGWASGSAGIGLRGLSQKNTLVLLNGRRVANYGFPSNGLSDTFVNLNALPLVAVQRMEVLKDGASAIYGSDAVAGVVNIITRQNFQGLEGGATYGTSSEGGLDTWRGKLVGGFGDLDEDRFNVLFSVEAYTRDRLDQDERDLTRSGVYTGQPGGRWNGWSAKGARFLVNGTSVPFLDAAGNCPTGMVRTASAPIDGLPGETCAINLSPYTTLIPSTDRYQGYVSGTYRVSDNVELFGEAVYSYIKGASIFGSSPYFTLEGGRFALNATTGLAEPVSNLLPANNPYNPYGVATPIEYTFFDLGQSLKTNVSKAYRVLGGVRGKNKRFDWEFAAFASASDERETVAAGFANRWALADALANGTLNLHQPEDTPKAVLDAIRLSTVRPAKSELYGADFKISGELFELPAGPIGYAAGVEYRNESLVSRNPWQIDAGLQIRPAIAAVDGEREVVAGYVEANIPILSTLELQVAGRGDHYSDFGSAFSPKAGVRWRPNDTVTLRASASRGFRAPSLSENSASTNISYGTVVDPYDPDLPGSRQSPTFFTVGNTDLDPERTRSFNVGAVFTPLRGSLISIDWYKIKLSNLVGTGNTTSIVQGNNPVDVIRDSRGKLVAVYNRYQNLTELTTSGLDIELGQKLSTEAYGDFTVSTAYTHVFDYRRPVTPGGALVNYAGNNRGAVLPADKATTRLGWRISDLDANLTWYHTSGYDLIPAVAGQSRVGAYDQVDLYVGWSGFEKVTIYAKVENVFDEAPPHDANFPGIRAPYDFSQYDLRGRYFQVGFDYRL
ncbi:TonB-dependent receptor plug domain-containing protein [Caulobacter endophyticus]|uniref:TonB-dependent receptor n=1 Tax=Caulobacter endophyticus TaxID=2172652 RepID=A0A2T9JGT9_9CAUL|nr:TonB-dependent receptor [Caulobacter endophyticus]PVM82902.1 TonB-dependent receptor [Caulobacter endophyticus]